MDDEAAANNAVEELNGADVKGRAIKVEKSESKGPRKPSQKLFIGNIREGTTNDELREVFERYTTVIEADVIKNFGFVHIDADAGRTKVNEILRELNGYNLKGNQIRVQLSTSGGRKGDDRGGMGGGMGGGRMMGGDRFGGGRGSFGGGGRGGYSGGGPMRGHNGGFGGGAHNGAPGGGGGGGNFGRAGGDPYPQQVINIAWTRAMQQQSFLIMFYSCRPVRPTCAIPWGAEAPTTTAAPTAATAAAARSWEAAQRPEIPTVSGNDFT